MAPWLPLALSARRLVSSLASASSRRRRLPAAALVTGAGRPCATGASSRRMALLDELDVELLSLVLSFLSPAPLLMRRRTLPRNARGRLLRAGARRKVRAQTINVQRSTLPPRASPPPWFAATDREAASAAGLGRARHAAAAGQVRLRAARGEGRCASPPAGFERVPALLAHEQSARPAHAAARSGSCQRRNLERAQSCS